MICFTYEVKELSLQKTYFNIDECCLNFIKNKKVKIN